MPVMDATGVSIELANKAGAHLMQHLFGVDITKDGRFEFEKSGAQQYAELRIAIDSDADAAIAKATGI
ncbi:MAG: hypothetical protein ABS87_00875 [Sphingomonas sp. SCN 67-18]|nr:MAG: hypothetical protein ABS87_00875 [Sphingomonas sp. SCN 67-18]